MRPGGVASRVACAAGTSPPCIFLSGSNHGGEECRGVTDRARLGTQEPVAEPWSSRPFSEHPEQLPGPRARISQGREAER